MRPADVESASEVLLSARKKGIRLWVEGDVLHYKARKGLAIQDDLQRIGAVSAELISLLCSESAPAGALPSARSAADEVPLTFSQLKYWNSSRLHEKPGVRGIAAATRLRGPLNVALLQRSIAEAVRRHEALRTRIAVVSGTPVQIVTDSDDYQLEVHDFTALSRDAREAQVRSLFQRLVFEPTFVTDGRLFAAGIAKLEDEEHVLILAIEHMVADAASRKILLRDVLAIYEQAAGGPPASLPAIPVQFADYAVWQRRVFASWDQVHGAFWAERLRGCGRLRFPGGRDLPSDFGRSSSIQLRIDEVSRRALTQWCRTHRTTLPMSVFTVFVAAALRWCHASDAVFLYQTDGRFTSRIRNTIGYFASVLPLRVSLEPSDSFADLLGRITDEYCKASEHNDYCYLMARTPRPDFSRNPGFNWISEAALRGAEESSAARDLAVVEKIPIVLPPLDAYGADVEPGITFYESSAGIVGNLGYSQNRFEAQTMAQFADNFLMLMQALVNCPERRIGDAPLTG